MEWSLDEVEPPTKTAHAEPKPKAEFKAPNPALNKASAETLAEIDAQLARILGDELPLDPRLGIEQGQHCVSCLLACDEGVVA